MTGATPDTALITAHLPPGSVMAPWLWLIHCNDLEDKTLPVRRHSRRVSQWMADQAVLLSLQQETLVLTPQRPPWTGNRQINICLSKSTANTMNMIIVNYARLIREKHYKTRIACLVRKTAKTVLSRTCLGHDPCVWRCSRCGSH